MIFLSHNFKDKPIVEPIAIKLATIFGMNKVFYDSWSMQPGEGIIDKMNDGLTQSKFFFFFVSKNSLASNMVKLEWQNALYKATQNKIKLIPIKLDDCLMPDILIQTLYIDIYGKGMEFGLRQIVDIIKNNNTFNGGVQTYENVRGYILRSSTESEIHIHIRAEMYVEPMSKYTLLFENSENEISINTVDQMHMQRQQFVTNVDVSDDYKCNGIYFRLADPTVPHFPIKFIVKKNTVTPIRFKGIMRVVSSDRMRAIPIIIE
ncbi:toll/interleukin-1 receptor domain-containing protein [uncultured Flavobacterium sp.]|uniref:toll/interleukin-1 receptor domain-containing protein n=1 Tax=uncultured Flavobacterium sp. TaxID=165435 RepID=UPI0030C87290